MRGALIVAAVTSCSHETKAPAPSPSASQVTTVAVAPAPIDPVRYSSADEAERFARLEAEDAANIGARRARIARLDRLAAQRREEQLEQEQRLLFGIGPGGPGLTGIYPGNQLSRFSCNACGRG